MAELQYCCGEEAEAVRFGEQALLLNPLSDSTRHFLLLAYLDLGEPAAARNLVEGAQHVTALDSVPLHLFAHDWVRAGEAAYAALDAQTVVPINEGVVATAISMHARATGQYARAARALQEFGGIEWDDQDRPIVREAPGLKVISFALAGAFRGNRQERRAQLLLEATLVDIDFEVQELGRSDQWYAGSRSMGLAMLNRTDDAIAALQRSYANGQEHAWWQRLEIDPAFDNVRDDARFEQILAKSRHKADQQRQRLEQLRRDGLVPRTIDTVGKPKHLMPSYSVPASSTIQYFTAHI